MTKTIISILTLIVAFSSCEAKTIKLNNEKRKKENKPFHVKGYKPKHYRS